MNRRVASLLNKAGATLLRHRKHLVFRLPTGERFVASSTPSDRNAYKNQLKDLEKLGVVETESQVTSSTMLKTRHAKPGRHDSRRPLYDYSESFNRGMADQLRSSRLVEDALNEQIRDLQQDRRVLMNAVDDYRWQQEKLKSELAGLKARRARCWHCRVADWWANLQLEMDRQERRFQR